MAYLILQGKRSPTEVLSWLTHFQESTNLHAVFTTLHFLTTVWKERKTPISTPCKKLNLVSANSFPFLDLSYIGEWVRYHIDFMKKSKNIEICKY